MQKRIHDARKVQSALENLAVLPASGKLSFVWQGIPISSAFEKGADVREGFLADTYLSSVYYDKEQRFITTEAGVYRAQTPEPEPFLAGGKIHQHNFRFWQPNGFSILQQSIFPALKEHHYLPEQGELSFSGKQVFRYWKEKDAYSLLLEQGTEQLTQWFDRIGHE